MKLEVLVVGLTEEVWFKGTRDERQVRGLNCLDRVSCAGQKLRDTFDYAPSPEELGQLNLAALEGQQLTIGVNQLTQSNGRVRVRGRIDMDSVPPAAKMNGNGKGHASGAPEAVSTSVQKR